MASVATVIPNSLNYADIKPQSVENEIKLNRFQPTANLNGAKPGDMIKFLLSGHGFLDPYSTYFSFQVTCHNLQEKEIRFLDRSAHSFIGRMIIRSQGVEIERIEQYDVIASMLNDMVYSPEQCTQHYWEGFPTHTYQFNPSNSLNTHFQNGSGRPLPAQKSESRLISCIPERDAIFKWLCQGSNPSITPYVGECAFHQLPAYTNLEDVYNVSAQSESMVLVEGHPTVATISAYLDQFQRAAAATAIDYAYFADFTYLREMMPQNSNFTGDEDTESYLQGGTSFNPYFIGSLPGSGTLSALYPLSFAYHEMGVRVPSLQVLHPGSSSNLMRPRGTHTMKFMIPIYSGIIGLLIPEKKLLPLNLLPLDIEITFNEHALYSSLDTFGGGSRAYTIDNFYIYGNTLFFENEIHRTLEANVADRGLFIYCNSFHMAPQTMIQGSNVPSSVQITMNLKSINSVHWLFLYSHYLTSPCARKQHFVSHNLQKVQLLNGSLLTPQYAVEGHAGTSKDGSQLQFVMELYKAWNKMHDTARDGSLHSYNMCGDQYVGQFDPMYEYYTPGETAAHEMIGFNGQGAYSTGTGFKVTTADSVKFTMAQILNKQGGVGRCQYALSLEGEELGSDRTMITGRKSQYPFQLQMHSASKWTPHVSYMFTFLRADYIVYLRPDLQVVTLGK